MAFFAVTTEKIAELNPIKGADFVELGKLEGMAFQFVVKKDEFKVGDTVVYFPIDSVMPQLLVEHFGIGKFLSGKEHNRVKTNKFKGEISQGFVASEDSVEKYIATLEDKDHKAMEAYLTFKKDMTEALGVTKYEPPVTMLSNAKLVRLPAHVSAYDIEGADRYTMVTDFMMDKEIYVSEKVEGMNFAVSIDADDKVTVCQRNYAIEPKEGMEHSFWKVAEELGLLDGVKKIKDLLKGDIKTATIRGEFTGPGSQGNYYELMKQTVYVFEIELNGKPIGANLFLQTMEEIGLKDLVVPNLGYGMTLKEWLRGGERTVQEASDGMSKINVNKRREGIVIKLMKEDRHAKLDGFSGRIFIKQRSPKYLAKEKD